MSKKVYLTEEQLHKVVAKAAKRIVNEMKKRNLQEGMFDFLKKKGKNDTKSPKMGELPSFYKDDINAPYAGNYVGLRYNYPKESPYNPYWLQKKRHPDWPLEKCKQYSKELIISDIGEEGFEHYKDQIWIPMKWTKSSTENF